LRGQDFGFFHRFFPLLLFPSTLVFETYLDGKYLSRVPEVAVQYAADPLNHEYASFLTAKDMLTRADELLFKDSFNFELPLLMVQGTDDQLCEYLSLNLV
jgi:alpha-beta hydrolase superfamily lysophospholipase